MEMTFEDATLLAEQVEAKIHIEPDTKTGMQKSVKHLHFIRDTITTLMAYLNGAQLTHQQSFAIGLLERMRHGSFSLIRTFDLIEIESPLSFSAGLTIRALILDYITTLKFLQVTDDAVEKGVTKEELDVETAEISGSFLADGIERTADYLIHLQAIGIMDEQQLQTGLNNMALKYANLIQPHKGDGSKPISKYKVAPSAGKMFKQLVTNKLLKNPALIYDTYLYFSKFDHFNVIYFETIGQPLNEHIKMFNKSIDEFVFHMSLLYSILRDNMQGDGVIEGQFQEVNQYLTKNYFE